jgi:hypothetical protein
MAIRGEIVSVCATVSHKIESSHLALNLARIKTSTRVKRVEGKFGWLGDGSPEGADSSWKTEQSAVIKQK